MGNTLSDMKGSIKNYFNEDSNTVIELIINYIKKLKNSDNKNIKTVIYFQDFNKFKNKVDSKKLDEFAREVRYIDNISIIIVDDYKKIKKFEYDYWYKNIQNDTDGIWIGTGLSDQNLFKLSKLTKEMSYSYKNNFGFVIVDGRADLIKTIELDEYKVDDEDE